LNRRPRAYESLALPTELRRCIPQVYHRKTLPATRSDMTPRHDDQNTGPKPGDKHARPGIETNGAI
jgi:hypothetical protein